MSAPLEQRAVPPTDTTYVSICFRQVRDELWPLLAATLVALGVACPWLLAVALGARDLAPLLCAVSAAPAWAGLVWVATRTADGETVGPLVGLGAAVHLFRTAAPLGAATGGFAWAFERALQEAGDGVSAMALPAGLSGCLLLLLVIAQIHAFPAMALRDSGPIGALRDGLGLAAAAPAATVGLLAAGVLVLMALRWAGPGTLMLTAPTLAVLVVQNTRMQLGRLSS
jgi:hypothetical protein